MSQNMFFLSSYAVLLNVNMDFKLILFTYLETFPGLVKCSMLLQRKHLPLKSFIKTY